MYILMLLVSRATCEWVQISQQHYRKPLRPHNFPLEETTQLYFEETTKSNRIYLNHTIGAQTWNKGNINKVPKLGSVQRVELNGNVVKAPNIRVIKNNRHDVKEISATAITNSDHEDQINFKGIGNEHSDVPTNIERPAQSSVRVKNTLTERKVSVDSTGKPLNKLEQANDINMFNRNPGNGDNSMGFRAPNIQTNNNKIPTHTGSGFSKVKPNRLFITGNDQTFVDEVININSFKDLDNIRIDQANANKGESFIEETISSHRQENKSNSTIKRKDEEYFNNVRKTENPFTPNEPNVKRNKTDPNRRKTKINNKETKQNESVEDNQRSEESSSETKPNTIENIMKFMTVISDTIRRNTRRGVNSKTRYLQNLKDTILANIEERIESAWPDDEPHPARRRREARGHHLEIPSSESALMSISFLTFAVFLIKLVLQVIQTYKNKAMMVTPAVVATVGRAATTRRDHD